MLRAVAFILSIFFCGSVSSQFSACFYPSMNSFAVTAKDSDQKILTNYLVLAQIGTDQKSLFCEGNVICSPFWDQAGTFLITVSKQGFKTVTTSVVVPVDPSLGCGRPLYQHVSVTLQSIGTE